MTQTILPRWLRIGFAVLALLVLFVATAAPVVAARGHVEAVGLYMALEPLCHQRADRSWSFGGLQAGLCIRCYGIYAGIVGAALMGLPFSRRVACGGAVILAAAWSLEHMAGLPLPEMARFASGGAFGLAMASIGTIGRPSALGRAGNRSRSHGVEGVSAPNCWHNGSRFFQIGKVGGGRK